jgi:hypothetical protein
MMLLVAADGKAEIQMLVGELICWARSAVARRSISPGSIVPQLVEHGGGGAAFAALDQ